ncbi:MAG: phosphate ABC transporter substrate-binding protein PstS [Pseudomonadota bacterium]
MHVKNVLFALAMMSCSGAALAAPEFSGAGSSAAQPLYAKWAEAYAKSSGSKLNYQAVGSSGGIARIKERSIDFGASDVAMPAQDLKKEGLICFPSAISGVVPVINLPGVKNGELRLTGEVLADIFARKIVKWNDPQIAALNPSMTLPTLAITVVVRQDGSGTTYNFTDYLSQISPAWKQAYGRNFTIAWPTEASAVKGSSGVVSLLKQTRGAISYVDYHYVLQDKLNFAKLKNRDGKFVAPTAGAFDAALNNSSWKSQATFEEMLTNKPGAQSWPITMGTFVIVPQESRHPEKTIAALKFFTWGFMRGDALVDGADFVRLPEPVRARIFGEMTKITGGDGQALDWSIATLLD